MGTGVSRLEVHLRRIFGAKGRPAAPPPQSQLSRTIARVEFTAAALAIAFVLSAIAAPPAHAQTLTILYSFTDSNGDGAGPYAGLASGMVGTACECGERAQGQQACFYGTTLGGGAYGYGTVFKLDPEGNETVLYSFAGSPTDGADPFAGLVMDRTGNLYGAAERGGAYGYGTVFKLSPSGHETVLHSFGAGTDGQSPYAGLIMDNAGNLYGTTEGGGAYGYGTVFKLDSKGKETVLYSFGAGSDGEYPEASLLMDGAGNLYSTTALGGAYGNGTVFKLSPSGDETVLLSFTGSDGDLPQAGLAVDRAGNLYGTTVFGGAYDFGTVFKLSPSGKETVLLNFTGSDGQYPEASLVTDGAGNLYSTTSLGGAYGFGTVFKLSPSGNETVLHSFAGNPDGYSPYDNLVIDTAGNLYGTTYTGGAYGYGAVFKLSLENPR
jgi:uncharacterized repeat protein (TIGR03803 family)